MSRQLLQPIYSVLILACFTVFVLTGFGHTVHAGSIGNFPPGYSGPTPPAPAPPQINSGGGQTIDSVTAPGQSGLDAAENSVAEEIPATTLGNPLYDLLYSFVLTVFGSLLAMAGGLMSYGMNEFVLGFGTQYFDKNVGFAIEATWTVIRDLFNLTFIFGLVWIGFKMILDSSDSRARSMLVSLIGAALLVNFSLFIVKFIIDIANITAVVIAKNGFGGQDIANSFINLINLSTILNITESQVTFLAQSGGAFSYIFGLMIFLATATFVLAAAGILFIVRFVVLNIYLVMSPVMFIGWVFPSMQSYSSKFWSGFLGNAFFAPAYLLMIYLSYTVLSTYKISLGKTIDYGRLVAGSGDPSEAVSMMHAVPFFVLAMAFMIASLVVAKKMGAVGASTAISIGNKLRGSAQVAMGAATLGLAARTGQIAVGGTASAINNTQAAKWVATRVPGGKALYNATAKVADSSFDVRNVGGLGKGIGVGAGMKGGNTTRIKEQAESDKKFMEALGSSKKSPAIIEAAKQLDLEKDKLKSLQTQLAAAAPGDKAAIVQKIDDSQKAIADLTEKSKFTAEMEYANQLAYIKGLEKWRKAQNIAMTGAAVVGAGILTGGTVFGLGAGLGLGSGAAAAAGGAVFGLGNSHNRNQTTKKARAEYGEDGTKKKKSKEQKDQMKILAAVMKESEDKKPEKKDDKKDDH